MTNWCGATPNTSPDSPSNGESGEVFGVALQPFHHKVLVVMGDESTSALLWRHMRSEGRRFLASNAFRRYAHLVFYAEKG